MIKVGLFGKNSDSVRHLLPEFNLELVEDKPEVIISYGGDGTLLSAERKFPGIPKLPIRDSKVCKKCSFHTTENLLGMLINGQLVFKYFPKLEARFDTSDILAINDIVIRNTTPMHALRFKIYRSGEQIKPDIIIGDGVVITTPFGSSGYYKSITRETIKTNFAAAFNNTTIALKPLKFTLIQDIKIVIVRGPGSLSSDNNPKIYSLKENDQIKIRASVNKAQIFLESLRCSECVVLRDKRLHN